MSLCVRSGWATRAFSALIGGLFCIAGWAQSVPKPRPRIQFDIRRHPSLTQQTAETPQRAAASLAGQRRLAAVAAGGQPGGSGTTLLRFNEFGLPKAVLHRQPVAPLSAQGDPVAVARNYLRAQSAFFPFSEDDLAGLHTAATSRSGDLTFLTLNQTIDGIPVFGGHVRIVLDNSGAVVQSGVDEVMPRLSVSTRPQVTPGDAVRGALRLLGVEPPAGPLDELASPRAGRHVFVHPGGTGWNPIVAELSIFPMGTESARLAYRIFVSSERGGYELLLDATDGALLYAADLEQRAGQARVWRQAPTGGPRELVDLPDAWLAAGATVTSGNNTDVYLDSDGNDRPDPVDSGNLSAGRAHSPSGMFDFPAGEGSTGQDPTEFAASAVTNAFFFVNAAHDYFYDLGFTEQAGNFQADNFGRGGTGNDALRTQVQDGNVLYNARFRLAPEGMSPILELGLTHQGTFFDHSDDRDYALDGDVVIHEYAHGVTSRMVGGPDSVNCLQGAQSGALSEGWSDYFGISYFDDPVSGEYSGNDAERGDRRYAYDKNPLTYEDFGNEGFRVHNDGEIWGATLWEIREALGAATADRLVMNALRMTPCDPSMIDARDAILDADQAAHNGSHSGALWKVFARRGMGQSASGFDGGFLDSTVFNASFGLPPADDGANRGPTILSRPREWATVGQPYVYSVLASDAEGDALTYELLEGPPGMEINSTGRVTVTPVSLTPERAKVAVTDSKGARVVHGFSVPVFPLLQAGRPITIDGPAFQEGYAGFVVSPGSPLVQFTLRGGDGDADLTVFGPDLTLAESFRFTSDETITIANPAPGLWLVIVSSVGTFSGVRLAASIPTAAPLTANSRTGSRRGAGSSETFYEFTVPEGADSFTVSTGEGSGDVDLYVAQGRYPICQLSFLVTTDCNADFSSTDEGNFEAITVRDDPVAVIPKAASRKEVQKIRLSAGEPVTVSAVATGQWFVNLSGFKAYEDVTLTLTVDAEGSAAPAISTGGVVHAASYSPLLAPGGIATLFGANLAAEAAQAATVPLPRELGGVRVLVGGVEAPLFYVSEGQINFQTPFETAEGVTRVMVERDGVPSAFVAAAVRGNSPGIFTYQRTAEVADPVVVHADGSVVSPENPAHPGEIVVIYVTGIGMLANPPATGEAAPSNPLAVSMVEPAVTIEGVRATVLFAGLTPSFVGLLQINVQLPAVLPAGDGLELVARFGNVSSPRVRLAVE